MRTAMAALATLWAWSGRPSSGKVEDPRIAAESARRFYGGLREADVLRAAARGRRHLESRQKSDGGFEPDGAARELRLGVTALAALALEGRAREQALDWIEKHQDADGLVADRQRGKNWGGWEHGYATIALVTRPAAFRKAVAWILSDQRRDGSWSSRPDLVQTGLQVTMIEALCFARRHGVEIPDGALRRAVDFLEKQKLAGGYRNHLANAPSPEITASAVAALQASGSATSLDLLKSAREFDLPEKPGGEKCTCYAPGLHLYGLFWTAVALFRSADDDRFERFYGTAAARLLAAQERDGSWGGWFGSEYGTTMALLTLGQYAGDNRRVFE